MTPTVDAPTRPAHVPPELVRPYPYLQGHKTQAQPHSFIAEVHSWPPVFWSDQAYFGFEGAWVPRRLADLQKLYHDNEHYSTHDFAPFADLLNENWSLLPAEIDPPLHAKYRAALNPVFTPKRMAQLEEKVREYARASVLAFKDRGHCEIMADLAFKFPIQVFLELMGLPQDQVDRFMAWEHTLIHGSDMAATAEATAAVNAYLRAECADRRINPREDLLTFGVQAEVDGRKLNDDELTGFCFNLFIGGLDTVSTNMGLQFRHLAEHPEDQAMLRENPERIGDAVEEFLRAYAATGTFRKCVKETTIGDVTVKPGDRVLLSTFLAGRDPEAYDDPDSVRLDRKPKHVSFGYGIHLCIGMHLARREMRIAIEEVLANIPDFRIAPDVEITSYLAGMIQPVELPLVWEA